MADDKNTANTSPFPEGYQPQSRRERREMEEYFARLAADKAAAEKSAAENDGAEKVATEKATPWVASASAAEVTESDTKGASERDHEVVASAEASAVSADAAVATSSAAKNTKREETANEETIADEESAADVETTKDFSEMTPKERRKAKRAEQAELTYSQAQEEGRLGEWLWVQAREGGTVILYALVIAFLVKTFLLRGFYIPSGSMEQTLQVNDRVFINVAGSYFSEPKRGDVIVFKDSQGWIPSTQKTSSPLKDALSFAGILPDTSSNFLVKRVIGTPGDVVESDGNGKIKVNGVEITEPYLYPGNPPSELAFKVTVPAGKYFVMGDHRSNSADSRYHISDGTAFISKDDVQGNVFVVAWPLNHFGLLQDQSSVFSSIPAPTSTPSE
ncbi:MAG: signal peptidase I [Rothia mucilaginosa]|jgi:signal peptidase I|uniref:signal peptidase I n=1 Tax=Rothia TaxID=32207 RepID=UPI0008ACC5C6|nr:MULTISPECIES: signal peptidase I [Rothia]MBF1651496.1 signal peptidase I [Rothia mucilaginosa]OFJ99468.1 S26 family signal peptidase [Rothia sp. HMSC065C12]OFO22827.1 S26 family signal peptidase [Rothia sp. HMSC061C12]